MLVSTAWLEEHRGDQGVVFVDMRWRGDGTSRELYGGGHVPGAVHLDWSRDLVDPEHPVAFMLAPPERFAAVMGRTGIGDGSTVVAYADEFGSGPFRLWWAFELYGHPDAVWILDGGWERWVAEGRSVSTDEPEPKSRSARWTAGPAGVRAATADDVAAAEQDQAVVVLDSRGPDQFRGGSVWFEDGPVPVDPDGVARTPRGPIRGGRIPGAVNVPWFELYRPDRTMKSRPELRDLFARAGLEPGCRAITYCGVGLSASALLYALHRAGFEDVALYDASWEEWGRDLRRPVARG